MRATRTALVVAILLLVGTRVQAQSLEAAKDLYASAEYDRALAMLDALKTMEHPREEQQAIELHRVLCLVATGKEADARGIIEGLGARRTRSIARRAICHRACVRLTARPARRCCRPPRSLRIRRRRPHSTSRITRAAERGFALVLKVLSDPDVEAAASKSPLADIRTLATGFHELSAKAAAPPEPVARALPQSPVVPSAASGATGPARAEGVQLERPERRATDRASVSRFQPSVVRFARPRAVSSKS